MKKKFLIGLIALLIGIDAISKYLVLHYLSHGEIISVFPGFQLHLALNHGVAFSLLHQTGTQAPWILILLSLVLTVVLASMLCRTPQPFRAQQLALCLMIAGAMANMLDRIRLGAVIDFIDWSIGQYHWPVFNLADSFICIGAVWLILKGYQDEKGCQHLCSSRKGS